MVRSEAVSYHDGRPVNPEWNVVGHAECDGQCRGPAVLSYGRVLPPKVPWRLISPWPLIGHDGFEPHRPDLWGPCNHPCSRPHPWSPLIAYSGRSIPYSERFCGIVDADRMASILFARESQLRLPSIRITTSSIPYGIHLDTALARPCTMSALLCYRDRCPPTTALLGVRRVLV